MIGDGVFERDKLEKESDMIRGHVGQHACSKGSYMLYKHDPLTVLQNELMVPHSGFRVVMHIFFPENVRVVSFSEVICNSASRGSTDIG